MAAKKMEPMKISFGFNKRTKTTNITSNSLKKEEKKLELIECLEGQSIKVKDAIIEEVARPLIIPLKDNQKNLLDRIRAAKNRDKPLEQKKDELEDTRQDSELSPDELAARQLIREAKDRLANNYSANNSKVSVLPISEDAQFQEGEKESTLEDYESVPISDYGLALLRGMGWKEGTAIGKNTSKLAAVSVPELRPKGLGLGATKIVKSEIPAKKAVDQDGNELILIKGCCAKVIAGPHKGHYCEVQGFDEDAGRVIIKVYPKGELVNMNESLLLPVTKEEFSKGFKVLNNAKYEEYKDKSDKKLDNYRLKSGSSDLMLVKDRSTKPADSDDEQSSHKSQKNTHKSRYKSKSPYRDSDVKQNSSKYHSRSKSRSRKSRSKSNNHYKSKRDNSSSSSSSNEEEYKKEKGSRSHSKQNRDRGKQYSSDEDYYEKDKKSKKHTKSKNRDRSRSNSRDKYKKNKKQNRYKGDSSDDDDKKEKRKKNKCKSRHRRNSSSSSEDRRYKSKR